MNNLLNYTITLVWFINGLYCKVLNGVPRHELIVARILGTQYAHWLTQTIGFLEILMAVWVISRIRPRLCALAQIVLVLTMNAIEFALAPDLLLFGQLNIVFAGLFAVLVYYNEFIVHRKPAQLPQ